MMNPIDIVGQLTFDLSNVRSKYYGLCLHIWSANIYQHSSFITLKAFMTTF